MNLSEVILFVALGAVVGFAGGLFVIGRALIAINCSPRVLALRNITPKGIRAETETSIDAANCRVGDSRTHRFNLRILQI